MAIGFYARFMLRTGAETVPFALSRRGLSAALCSQPGAGYRVWTEASRLAGSIPRAAALLERLTREDPAAVRLLPR